MDQDDLDCLIVGAGPAGLTAALYLARFRRRFAVVDAGDPRAAWIPTSHNIPFFEQGIGGPELLSRQRANVEQYGVRVLNGTVTALARGDGIFTAIIDGAAPPLLHARRVLLATGSRDHEPDLPSLPDAVRRGIVRYCPICDGYEARDRRIAVIGHGAHALAEAVFIARTYSADVTMLSLGQPLGLDLDECAQASEHGISLVEHPIESLHLVGDRVGALRAGGQELQFEVLYSALGLDYRTSLADQLGAERDASGALVVDEHNQTTVSGLYAAGDVARGLDQISVALAHAATAATHIHNRCELPTADEPDRIGRRQPP